MENLNGIKSKLNMVHEHRRCRIVPATVYHSRNGQTGGPTWCLVGLGQNLRSPNAIGVASTESQRVLGVKHGPHGAGFPQNLLPRQDSSILYP